MYVRRMFGPYQCILPKQILFSELIPVQIAQMEWSANFRLSISFAHLDNAFSFHPRLFILEVQYQAGGGRKEQAG